MRNQDSRAAPRLRFSEDEQLPVEQAEPAEKLTRKIKWQFPKEAEAQVTESVPQEAAIQPLQNLVRCTAMNGMTARAFG